MASNVALEKPVHFPNPNGTDAEVQGGQSASNILTNCMSLVLGKLNPLNNEIFLLSDNCIQSLIDETEIELEKAKALLIEGMLDKPKIRDKQQFVQLNQAFLINLMNKLYAYRQNKRVDDKIRWLYTSVSKHLQNTLDFIEEFFGNYFDHTEKVPAFYLAICKEEMALQLKQLITSLEKVAPVDKYLTNLIISSIRQFGSNDTNTISYSQLSYQKDILNELVSGKALLTTKAIRETLYHLNFNEDNFIAYENERLSCLTADLPTKKEKINLLRFEQKNINQLTAKLNYSYTTAMPSLKEQMNGWIDEEIKFLENADASHQIDLKASGSENKIHTSLSVAKLSLIIRLLVIDKIIINRTVAPMLRVAAKMFTTLQKEDISFGSLETKYHAPDKATINAVKDMLFKWINILNKL